VSRGLPRPAFQPRQGFQRERLHPLGCDVRAARDQEGLFIGVIENLEAEGVNQHPVARIDEVEPVDHSFTGEPGGVVLQKGRRRARQLVVEPEVNIHQ